MKRILVVFIIIISIFLINTNKVDSRDKKLYYDNFRYTDNVEFNDNFDYNVSLNNVGDYYEIIFDVVNESNIEYELKDLLINDNDEYFSYNLTYLDDKKIDIGDKIDKNSIVTLKYRVDYVNLVTEENYELDTNLSLEFGQSI